MRHLRCPQRFLPGLEGGELFPPGHDASPRAWSSFGRSSFSSSLAVPSNRRDGRCRRAIRRCPAPIWPCCPMWNCQPSVASTMSTGGQDAGRSRPFAAPVKVDSGGAWRARPRPNPAGPSADTRADLLPLREAPPPPAGRHRPACQVPPAAGGRHSRRAVRQGDAVEQHRPAERDDPDEAPGPPAPAPPGTSPDGAPLAEQTDALPLSRWVR